MEWFGISICGFDKTIQFHKINTKHKPPVETAGLSLICYWFKDKQNALKKTLELLKNDFKADTTDYYKFLEWF